jgi:small-conductance mechanosensitive channel
VIEILGLRVTLETFAKLAVAVLAVVVGSLVGSSLLQRALATWGRRRGFSPEDTAMPVVRRYLLPILLVGALYLTLASLALPTNVRVVVGRVLAVVTLALGLYLVCQITLALLHRISGRSQAGRRVGPQVQEMARIGLFLVSASILLDNLGVRVTALVTTLGIGSAAVAFALRDTLANLFAGFYIQADRPLALGHYIRLDNGQEGLVEHIGWRSTHMRTLDNTTVVIPNEKLSQAIITNLSLPDQRAVLSIRVTVSYAVELATVDRLMREATDSARADVPGILAEPPPTVRLIPGFGDKGLDFTLTVMVRQFVDQAPAEDALRRHLLDRFRAAALKISPGPEPGPALDRPATSG